MARATRYGPQPIKKVLAAQGRTLAGAARICGLHYNHVRGAADGWHPADTDTREGLPAHLGVPIEQLFTPESLAGKLNKRRPRNAVSGE
jgi:hypothetical protein